MTNLQAELVPLTLGAGTGQVHRWLPGLGRKGRFLDGKLVENLLKHVENCEKLDKPQKVLSRLENQSSF